MAVREDLIEAVDAALAGGWDAAHAICQRYESNSTACWLHACLHKMEPDEANSRYWYRRSSHAYEEYPDPKQELGAIKAALTY
ncbi:MAG: hypothetical protein JSS20_09535 [Proteobacteria bacterium]|nr:hypothetical protein [Pseudomonadota bacterium]